MKGASDASVPKHPRPDPRRPLEANRAGACLPAGQAERGAIKLIAIVEDLPWYTRLVLPTAEELQTLLVREKSEELEGLAEACVRKASTTR